MRPKSKHPTPPRLASWILRKILGEKDSTYLLGDFEEIFHDKRESKGSLKARLWYWRQLIVSVFTVVRDFLSWQVSLIEKSIIIAIRNLLKSKGFSAINLSGLVIGMIVFLVILQYVSFEKSYDRFHENTKNIYRLVNVRYYKSGTDRSAGCAPTVGPNLKKNFSEVMEFTRCIKEKMVITVNGIPYKEERAFFADPSFFRIFSFPAAEGDLSTALKDKHTAVLTESTARKYFGDSNPLGKTFQQKKNDYRVTGVVKDVPSNSHLKFDILLSHNSMIGRNYCAECNNTNTYILLNPMADPIQLESKFPDFIKKTHKNYGFERDYFLQPLTDIHLRSNLRFEHEKNGNGQLVHFLTAIAFFLLVIAWLNYINLTTARSMNRAREVGIRKVTGALRIQIVKQFLMESFLVNLAAITMSLVLLMPVISLFNRLFDATLNKDIFGYSGFWIGIFTLLVFGTIIAGLYPAMVISAFKPATVLKGRFGSSKKGIKIRNSLIIFQSIISITLIFGTLTVYKQISYMKNRDLGIDIKQTLTVRDPEIFPENFSDQDYYTSIDIFMNESLKKPEITGFTFATFIPGEENDEVTGGIRPEGQSLEAGKQIYFNWVADNFFETFDIRIKHGRNFLTSDITRTFNKFSKDKGIILNETAVKALGFKSPGEALNRLVVGDDGPVGRVIGIIQDFHQEDLSISIRPTIFFGAKWGTQFFLKISGGDPSHIVSMVRKIYADIYPGNPFEYHFVDRYFNSRYRDDNQFGRVFGTFTLLAIFIATLGLLGVTSYAISMRFKEIGMRKVMGASIGNIMMVFNKEYLKWILMANILAWPLAYWVMNRWLQNYAYKISIGYQFFLISGIISVSIMLITVSWLSFKASRSNPLNVIKT